jgi:riboflavin kinase/FMN adenylyltransferase
MKIYPSLEHELEPIKPVFLTIGNFDGVHLGHQTILKNLQVSAALEQLPSCVITFSNHPSQILRPNHPIPLLTSREHKLKLLENLGVDIVFMLDFTLPFSQQSAESFLRNVHQVSTFRRLILGADAKLGNDRQGDTPLLHELGRQLHFSLDFLPLETAIEEPITSSRIRSAVQNADLATAAKLLGRKFSIMGNVMHGRREGHKLGYPTLNLGLEGMCHPPLGVYAVRVLHNDKTYPAVANLGIAPTVRNDHVPLLEVHLLDQKMDLYDQSIEVVFEELFRPERAFASTDELVAQIENDVQQAKAFFKLGAI